MAGKQCMFFWRYIDEQLSHACGQEKQVTMEIMKEKAMQQPWHYRTKIVHQSVCVHASMFKADQKLSFAKTWDTETEINILHST